MRRLGAIVALVFVAFGMVACGIFRAMTPLEEPPALLDAALPRGPVDGPAPFRALFVLGHEGTEIFDLMAPYEVFAASGAFAVSTVAAERRPLPLTGRIAALPHVTFRNAPPADVIVVPAVADPKEESLLSFLSERARERARSQPGSPPLFLSVCEGARALAAARVLDGKRATTHFFAVAGLAKDHPEVEFVEGHRYVYDPPILSSAGVSSALDASLEAVALMAGEAVAAQTADELGIDWLREEDLAGRDRRAPTHRVVAADVWRLLSGYLTPWHARELALWLRPGSSEIAVAALADAWPRTLRVSFRVVGEPGLIETRHGLHLLAGSSWDDVSPDTRVLIPGPAPFPQPPVGTAQVSALEVGRALSGALDDIERELSPEVRGTVATLLEYPR